MNATRAISPPVMPTMSAPNTKGPLRKSSGESRDGNGPEEPGTLQATWEAPVVLGLGANQKNPLLQLRGAAARLAVLLGPCRVSGLYRSAPLGPAQPDFLNAAILGSFEGPLADLLREMQRIELEFGRERNIHWGPRTLDIDLLWAGERTSHQADLVVPHPELTRRAFALQPLLDLQAEAVEPGTRTPYRVFLEHVRSQRIVRICGSEWAFSDATELMDTLGPEW